MSSCDNNDINVVIPNYKCWTTEHLLHVGFSLLFILLMIAIAIPTSAFFYENNCSSLNAFKKVSSSSDILNMLIKAILTASLILFGKVLYLIYYLYSLLAILLLFISIYCFLCFFAILFLKKVDIMIT